MSLPPLPVDVWSTGVFPYLDYRSMLRCSEVSRQFLHQVVPNIKQLVIERPRDMHMVPARKFIGVEIVDIRCFGGASSRYGMKGSICQETSDRVVPFVGCFQKAKEVYLCGGTYKHDYRCHDGEDLQTVLSEDSQIKGVGERVFLYLPKCQTGAKHQILERLILSICGAYRTGVIPSTLTFYGLFESDTVIEELQATLHDGNETDTLHAIYNNLKPLYNSSEAGCHFCNAICSSIPVVQACNLNCAAYRGQEFVGPDGCPDGCHCLCLTPDEKVDIIMSRNGGKELYWEKFKCLYSKERIDFTPFWGKNCFRCDSEGNPDVHGLYRSYVLEMWVDAIAELKILIDRYGFPPLSHSEAFVIECLFKDTCQEEQMTRDKEKCFIHKQTLDALCKLFGLHLNPSFFIIVDDEYLCIWTDFTANGRSLEQYHEEGQEFTGEDLAKLRRRCGNWGGAPL